MLGFARCNVMGNVVHQPNFKETDTLTKVADFIIAVNRQFKKGEEIQEEVYFFKVVAFGRIAEKIRDRIHKSDSILIEGAIRQERWKSEEGEERSRVAIFADRIEVVQKYTGASREALNPKV